MTTNIVRECSTAEAAHWRSLSSGLRIIKVGLCISLGTTIAMAALAPLVAVPDHIGFINDLDEMLAIFLPIVAALGGIVGGILVLIGDWVDTGVPKGGDARRLAFWSAVTISVGLPLLLTSPLLGVLATAVSGLAAIFLTARNILFLLLLMHVAAALGHAEYRQKMVRFLIYWLGGGAIVAVACGISITAGLGVSTSSEGLPQIGGDELLPGLPFFVMAAIIFVAYSSLLLLWLLHMIHYVRVRLPVAAALPCSSKGSEDDYATCASGAHRNRLRVQNDGPGSHDQTRPVAQGWQHY